MTKKKRVFRLSDEELKRLRVLANLTVIRKGKGGRNLTEFLRELANGEITVVVKGEL